MSHDKLFKLIMIILGYGKSFIPNSSHLCPIEKLTGNPLILTPYIKSGDIEKAQKLSVVNLPGFEDVKSHSGYFTVNQEYNSNTFFWYFVAENSAKDAPVILWLQGGPGMSSLFGLFLENGPFLTNGKYLERRYWSWNKDYHLIYFDNPVGTGFSFTNGGYAKNITDVGRDLYSALKQFFELFPDLKNNEFYIAGESFAGKYIPVLSYMIHEKNREDNKINLKGMAIGNGYSNPEFQFPIGELLYNIGLLDIHQAEQLSLFEQLFSNCFKGDHTDECCSIIEARTQSHTTTSYYVQSTGYLFHDDLLNSDNPWFMEDVENLMKSSELRKFLHLGDRLVNETSQYNASVSLYPDYYDTVSDLLAKLLSYYRVLIYNGMLDLNVPYRGSEDYLMNMTFTGHEEFKKAPKIKWFVNGEVAGYMKSGGNLSSVVVRNAGHSVPADQPEWMMDLLNRFINNQKFY